MHQEQFNELELLSRTENNNLNWAFPRLVILSFFIFCRFKKRRGPSKQPLRLTLRNAIPKEYYESLDKATDGFPLINLIGVGSFDAVYNGVFDLNRAVVAIKVLSIQCQGASKSFMCQNCPQHLEALNKQNWWHTALRIGHQSISDPWFYGL